MDYTKLQNGSDIRGVAMEGIEGQHVNLTEQACRQVVEQAGYRLVSFRQVTGK